MVMMTYKMPDEIKNIASDGMYDEFSLNEFFAASENNGSCKFKHEAEVVNWLNLMRGQYLPTSSDKYDPKNRPPMPYSDINLLSSLTHTFWFLPTNLSAQYLLELCIVGCENMKNKRVRNVCNLIINTLNRENIIRF